MSMARYWLNDMQECMDGEHGDWWAERFEESVLDAANGRHDGSWQVWRDTRQAETAPVPQSATDEGRPTDE